MTDHITRLRAAATAENVELRCSVRKDALAELLAERDALAAVVEALYDDLADAEIDAELVATRYAALATNPETGRE